MCSRFNAGGDPKELQRRFGDWDWPDPLPGEDRHPTDAALALDPSFGARLLTWGIPSPVDGKPLINARAETLTEKPTFRPLLNKRVLVPARAYYEWRKQGKRRFKNRIGRSDGEMFAIAGLTDGRFLALVTREPVPAVAHIHRRMPAILPLDGEAAWMDPALAFEEVRGLLAAPAPPLAYEEEAPAPEAQMSLFLLTPPAASG